MGGVWRTAKQRKRTCVGVLRLKHSSGGVWHTAKWDSMGYCSYPPSTSSSLHGLLFIHRRPPPASICDCSSTGSCSSSLHRALLHRLLFNHPSPRGPVQPPLHGLLFIQPSTNYFSTSLPPATVRPSLHGVLFIQTSTGSYSSTPTRNCSSTPPPQQCSLFIKGRRQQGSIGFT